MLDMHSYLHFNKITMVFPGVKALSNISFSVKEGSVHALMGENGAGKSTLLKILSGIYRATHGSLIINGEEYKFKNAADALQKGVAIIYQELNLVPELTVAENIYLGQMPIKNGIVDKKELLKNAMIQLQRLGENIHPSTPLKNLSIGQCQMLEIAKALSRNAKVIAFDEPTSSLSSREIENLFKVIRELRSEGKVIIYVSHRMEEIFKICDALTVFKDGTHVETFYDMAQLSQDKLVKLMVGREINDVYRYRTRQHGDVGLQLTDLMGVGLRTPISLSIKKGEILGLFGLVGAGRTELTRLIFGAEVAKSGTIAVDGTVISIKSPKDAIKKGITYCPEDRKASGIIPIATVQENTNISARPWNLILNLLINKRWEEQNAIKQINGLRIKTPSAQQVILNLSGGNQQKVILGRWLSTEMKVIILDEPTRGIDVGSKAEIYDLIFQLAEQGVTVLVISSDLPEVLGLSDRLLIMKDGAISGELMRDAFNEEQALRLAMLESTDLEKNIA